MIEKFANDFSKIPPNGQQTLNTSPRETLNMLESIDDFTTQILALKSKNGELAKRIEFLEQTVAKKDNELVCVQDKLKNAQNEFKRIEDKYVEAKITIETLKEGNMSDSNLLL